MPHYVLITLRLARHFKVEFRLTKRSAELAQAPGKLFAELVPFFISRSTTRPMRALKVVHSGSGMSG